jgi:hypothetical protein
MMALAAACFVPTAAPAAEVLGSVTDAGACGDNQAYVGPSVASGPDYIADTTGVITTYRMTAGPDPSTIRLLVLQPGAGTEYTAVQEDAARTQAVSGAVNTQTNVHLPITAGQIVGVYVPVQPSGEGWCLIYTGQTLDAWRGFIGEPALNVPSMFSASDTSVRMNLEATVEPDPDKDTFGNETQDKCLLTPGPYSGCPNTVQFGKVKLQGGKVKTFVTVPGAGTLRVGSKGKMGVKPASRTVTNPTPQGLAFSLKLKKAARQALADTGKLKLKLQALYAPPGSPAGTTPRKAKLKA